MGAMVTSIFRVNLTRAGWEQPRLWYPAKLWDPVVKGVVSPGPLGLRPAQPCSRTPPHSLKTEGGDA